MLRLARWLALLLPRCLRGGGGGGTFSELSTLARVAVDVVRVRALRGMMGFERSGHFSMSGSVSSDVDSKLESVTVSLGLRDVRRDGGGGGVFEGCENEDKLEGDCGMLVIDCNEGLLRDNGGLVGPWLRRRLRGGVGGRLICIEESVPTVEVALLRRELSDGGGSGSGLLRSDSGDLDPGEIGLAVEEVEIVSGIAAGDGLIGLPCRGLGAGGGFLMPSDASPGVTALLVVVDSFSSSSCEVRGLSAAMGGIGSNID
jgi:hypothetical protein